VNEEFRLPRELREHASEAQTGWLTRLPSTATMIAAQWSLTLDAPYEPGGRTAWVAPATLADGTDVTLKIGWRHSEAEHEADGLRVWDGDGTVRLLAETRVSDSNVLMLERCVPGSALSTQPDLDQDTIVAGLLTRLWRAPTLEHPFRPLSQMCDEWADSFAARFFAGDLAIDAGLVRAGMTLLRSLPRDATRSVLLATDLHAGNVLASEREPWLMIDPKPYVGDPTYDALQHLLNSEARLREDPLALVDRMAGLLDLGAERLRLWLFARCIKECPEQPYLLRVARVISP
jgi:streptomycin 6-kinase